MELLYKDDWPLARERTMAWYRCEVIDRCAIRVATPRDGVKRREFPPFESLEDQWTDIDAILDRAEERFRTVWFGGESIPLHMPNLGPNVMSAWCGCPMHFAETTTWTDPIIRDWDTFPGLKFDERNPCWQWLKRATARAAERGQGKWITAVTDLHGGGDGLAALRGTQDLCTDLALNPEKVKEAERFLRALWFKTSEELYRYATSQGQDGSGGFLGWGPGRTWPLQEDLLALISPKMGIEFFAEAISEQAKYLDAAVFHLDGPESLPHLDWLLDIPDLDGIQWQPGHAHKEMTQWIPLLKRIQSAGKCILISATPQEIEVILREMPARGLMIGTGLPTEAEGRAFLKKVQEWTR